MINKGKFNAYSVLFSSNRNVTNGTNEQTYKNVISGTLESETFNYLLNFNAIRLNDVKSINRFNHSGIIAEQNSIRNLEEIINDNAIKLEKIKLNNASLKEVLKNRKSVRDYSGEELSFKNFSQLIYNSFGINDARTIKIDDINVPTRFYASGGGLYPVEIYLYIRSVENIKNGLYLYQPYSNSILKKNNELELDKILENNVIDYKNLNVAILFKVDMNRAYIKYGELSLLNIFVEIGLMSQTYNLVGTSLGIRSCDIAGFSKKIAEKNMNIDGINSHILYMVASGREK